MIKMQSLSKFDRKDLERTLDKKAKLKIEEAKQVAKEFETLFVDIVLKKMRETSKPDNESNAMHIYTSMLDSEYSKSMTEAENFGIRDMILEWMTQNDPVLKDKLSINSKQALKTYKNNS